MAPTAIVCGDVRIGPDARILFGAVLTAEDGSIEIGERCVVMENALLRGREQHPTRLGDDVLVGPHAHVNGVTIEDGCFIATGAALFPGAVLGTGTEVRDPRRGAGQHDPAAGLDGPDRLGRGRRPGADPPAGPP